MSLSPAQIALSLLILASFAVMAAALIRLVLRLFLGEPILAGGYERRRAVPWGWISVALVGLAFWAVSRGVVQTYLSLRENHQFQVGPVHPRAELKGAAGEKPPAPGKPGLNPASPGLKDEPRFSFTEQMFLVSIINLVLAGLIPLLLRLTCRARLSDFGLTREGLGRRVVTGLGAFLVVTPCVMVINLLAIVVWRPNSHPLEGMLREGLTPGGVLLAYASAMVLAPVAEELVFRGVLQGWFSRLQGGPEPLPESGPNEAVAGVTDPYFSPPAQARPRWLPRFPFATPGPGGEKSRSPLPIVLTSLIFAAVHAPQMPAPFAIFFLSLALGWLIEATGSVVPSITLHAAFNGFNTTLMVFSLSMPAPNRDAIEKIEPPTAQQRIRVRKSTFRLAHDAPADKFFLAIGNGSCPFARSTSPRDSRGRLFEISLVPRVSFIRRDGFGRSAKDTPCVRLDDRGIVPGSTGVAAAQTIPVGGLEIPRGGVHRGPSDTAAMRATEAGRVAGSSRHKGLGWGVTCGLRKRPGC